MNILLIIFLPVFASLFVLFLPDERKNLRESISILTGIIVFGLVLMLLCKYGNESRLFFEKTIFLDFSIAFHIEPLSMIFALLTSFLFIVCSFYSIGYMRAKKEKFQSIYYFAFLISISAALGVAFSANLLTLFIFYELLTISTFILVGHNRDEKAKNGARIYASILLFGSLGLLLPAIIITYSISGSLDFVAGGVFGGYLSPLLLFTLLGLYVFGIGKAALMPMHQWLPNAMVAPTPVSAFLHAVAVVKVGVFSILKVIIYVFGFDVLQNSFGQDFFITIAAVTILLSSIIAMNKDNLKARLAYSTISQLAYVTLGALLANKLGIIGGISQLVMHAFAKMTLFMCAGAIYVASSKTLVSQLDGLGRKMPITFIMFFIASLSIIGLPPVGGVWPKFYLMAGSYDYGSLLLMFVLLVSSLMNVWYLLSIPIRAFMFKTTNKAAGTEAINWEQIKEAPFFCVFPAFITCLGCVVLFFSINIIVLFIDKLF